MKTNCTECSQAAHQRASECKFYGLTWRGNLTEHWRRFVTAGGGYGVPINSIGCDLLASCGADDLKRYERPGTGMHALACDAMRQYDPPREVYAMTATEQEVSDEIGEIFG